MFPTHTHIYLNYLSTHLDKDTLCVLLLFSVSSTLGLCVPFILFIYNLHLPHDDTLPRQKTPASPDQHRVLIPYGLFSPTEPIDTTQQRLMLRFPHHSSFTQQNLKSYDQPDDGRELAETCRCVLIRIYFLHATVVLLTAFNIYNLYLFISLVLPMCILPF